jgi:hypothetical protein
MDSVEYGMLMKVDVRMMIWIWRCVGEAYIYKGW